ncbi:hypothetical protein ACHWQZ_G005540 [Mnemiopsis leidyi]
MNLNSSDLNRNNKNRVFKRLMDRKYPVNTFTTLVMEAGTETEIYNEVALHEEIYCTAEDVGETRKIAPNLPPSPESSKPLLPDRQVPRRSSTLRPDRSSTGRSPAPTRRSFTRATPPSTKQPLIVPPSTKKPTIGPPLTKQPLIVPPSTKKPIIGPPSTKPPLTGPPPTKPPLTGPPPTKPPLTGPPTTKPPLTGPPPPIPPRSIKKSESLNWKSSQSRGKFKRSNSEGESVPSSFDANTCPAPGYSNRRQSPRLETYTNLSGVAEGREKGEEEEKSGQNRQREEEKEKKESGEEKENKEKISETGVKVRTLVLCWWSEKLNNLTDSIDSIITLHPVFKGRKKEVSETAALLSGEEISAPSLGLAEASVLFGLIYEIPELVEVNTRWTRGHITPKNFQKVVRMYQQASLHDPLHVELLNIVREFLQNTSPGIAQPLVSELIKYEPEWVQIIGLQNVPLCTLRTVLHTPNSDPDKLCAMVCTLVDRELNKSDDELDRSFFYARLVSQESTFREFLSELSERVTDIGNARMIFRTEQRLSRIIMSLSYQ